MVSESDAKRIALRLDPSEGEVMFFQSDGQIMHPHLHRGQTGREHVDAWACRKQYGTIQVAKIHSDDEFDAHYRLSWVNV